MKTREEIEKIVCDGVIETFDLKEEISDKNISFKQDLDADSIDMVSLSLVLEEEFNADIEEDQLRNFITINNVIDYIVERQIQEVA